MCIGGVAPNPPGLVGKVDVARGGSTELTVLVPAGRHTVQWWIAADRELNISVARGGGAAAAAGACGGDKPARVSGQGVSEGGERWCFTLGNEVNWRTSKATYCIDVVAVVPDRPAPEPAAAPREATGGGQGPASAPIPVGRGRVETLKEEQSSTPLTPSSWEEGHLSRFL